MLRLNRTDQALIFDIQRFSIHDGPGIRTTLFFKGCSFACSWCHNPESIKGTPELAFYADRCTGCGDCLEVCKNGCISLEGADRIDRSGCQFCRECAKACSFNALVVIGEYYPVDKLAGHCLEDREFFKTSSGGVTLSGGEPVLQSGFLMNLLPILKKEGIHLLLETAGNYRFEKLEPLLEWINAIYYDIKMPTSESYCRHTGADNSHVWENLGDLTKRSFPLEVRIPVIPGLNTESYQIAQLSHSLLNIGINRVRLLTYNPLWESKLQRLGKSCPDRSFSRGKPDYPAIVSRFKKFMDEVSFL